MSRCANAAARELGEEARPTLAARDYVKRRITWQLFRKSVRGKNRTRGFRVKSDVRNRCANVQPRLYICASVTHITLNTESPGSILASDTFTEKLPGYAALDVVPGCERRSCLLAQFSSSCVRAPAHILTVISVLSLFAGAKSGILIFELTFRVSERRAATW